MLFNSNNSQHIEKIFRIFVDNLILQLSLKFQVDRTKIVRVLLLAELKKGVLRKMRLKFAFLSTCFLIT